MIFEIKIPSPGESITEVEIGSIVKKDQEIAEIESDKATLSLTASAAVKLNILLKEGERVAVGTVVCTLDSDETVKPTESDSILLNKLSVQKPEVVKVSSHPVPDSKPSEIKLSSPEKENHQIKLTPAAKAVMEEEGLSIDDLLNGLRRISRKDVELVLTMQKNEPSKPIVENTRDEDLS